MATDTLGGLIRHLRERADLSQEELAAQAQVARATIQNWERDARKPRRAETRRLAAALGVDVATLIAVRESGEGQPAPESAEELRQDLVELQDELENLTVKYERNRPLLVEHLQQRIAIVQAQLNSLPDGE